MLLDGRHGNCFGSPRRQLPHRNFRQFPSSTGFLNFRCAKSGFLGTGRSLTGDGRLQTGFFTPLRCLGCFMSLSFRSRIFFPCSCSGSGGLSRCDSAPSIGFIFPLFRRWSLLHLPRRFVSEIPDSGGHSGLGSSRLPSSQNLFSCSYTGSGGLSFRDAAPSLGFISRLSRRWSGTESGSHQGGNLSTTQVLTKYKNERSYSKVLLLLSYAIIQSSFVSTL